MPFWAESFWAEGFWQTEPSPFWEGMEGGDPPAPGEDSNQAALLLGVGDD